jgi:hypothetical protein
MYVAYGEGSGRSRNPRLLGRDLARLAAYGLVPVLLARGGRAGRLAVAAGAAGYLSLPAARVLRHPGGRVVALGLLPVVTAVRDLAKVAGALRGLRRGDRG